MIVSVRWHVRSSVSASALMTVSPHVTCQRSENRQSDSEKHRLRIRDAPEDVANEMNDVKHAKIVPVVIM